MIQKTIGYQGLHEVNTPLVDTSVDSDGYLNITLPTQLTAGRNLIKINPNNSTLKLGSEIRIEILDASGDTVYYEVSSYRDSSDAVHIIPVIYDDTFPGYCVITILAEVSSDINGAPSNTTPGVPNYKWQHKLNVIPQQRNSTPIIFGSQLPNITVSELVKTYMDRSYGTTQFLTQSSNTVEYQLIGSIPTIQSKEWTFDKSMENGTIFVTASALEPESKYPLDTTIYSASIVKVLSDNHAVLDKRYEAPHRLYTPSYHVPSRFGPSSYELHYESEPTYSLTENSRSFAFIELNNLKPISGEIYRIKTFMKSAGTVSTYELVDDSVVLDSPYREKLIDTGSDQIRTSMGIITDQSTVDTYWTASVYNVSLESGKQDSLNSTNPATLSFDSGINLPRSFEVDTLSETYFGVQYIKLSNDSSTSNYKSNFTDRGEYKFVFDAMARYSDKIGNLAGSKSAFPKISVFMSGSAFRPTSNKLNLGKYIGQLDTSEVGSSTTNTWRYDDHEISFVADSTGSGIPVFVIESGVWNIGELSLYADFALGFNPCNVDLLVPLPTEHINDEKDLKFEFYDSYGNLSPLSPEFRNVNTAGGNTYIGGGYNLLTGSLFVAGNLGGGVEIQGSNFGGLVRSIGYTGFLDAVSSSNHAGFMIWSGSVLPGSGDFYSGTGLELVANDDNFFKFRTNPSEFIVKTEQFFFGNSAMYISGSDGKIEIFGGTGGNDFHLENNGQVRIRKSGSIMLDTDSGFSDGVNVGRHIWSFEATNYAASQSIASSSLYTAGNYGPNSGSEDPGLSRVGRFKFNLFPGEDQVSVAYRGWSTDTLKEGKVVIRLHGALTGSMHTSSGYFPWDEYDYGYSLAATPNLQIKYFFHGESSLFSGSEASIGNLSINIPNILTGSLLMGHVFLESTTTNPGTIYCDMITVTTGRELQSTAQQSSIENQNDIGLG